MFPIESLVAAVITLIVLGLIAYLLWWLVGFAGIPEPFAKVARIVIAVFCVLVIISILLGMIGHPFVRL